MNKKYPAWKIFVKCSKCNFVLGIWYRKHCWAPLCWDAIYKAKEKAFCMDCHKQQKYYIVLGCQISTNRLLKRKSVYRSSKIKRIKRTFSRGV